jgi:uncharacterized protein YbaA (DUF1428 family)
MERPGSLVFKHLISVPLRTESDKPYQYRDRIPPFLRKSPAHNHGGLLILDAPYVPLFLKLLQALRQDPWGEAGNRPEKPIEPVYPAESYITEYQHRPLLPQDTKSSLDRTLSKLHLRHNQSQLVRRINFLFGERFLQLSFYSLACLYTILSIVYNMSKIESAKEVETGTHVQLFVYRIPKKNHDTMIQLQRQLTGIFKKHGILRSEFFQLGDTETFQGFTSIAKTVSADPEEEVWVELESYRDRKHRDDVVAKVTQDANAGPLFGQVMGLITQGYSCIMGEFKRLHI